MASFHDAPAPAASGPGWTGDDALDNALGSYGAIQQVKSGATLTLL